MGRSRILALLLPAAVMMIPGYCFGAERPQIDPPAVQMLKQGTAKISNDAKSLVDDKGRTLAKSAPPPKETDYEDNVDPYLEALYSKSIPGEKEGAPPKKSVYTCSRKCAIMEKKCFADDTGNSICVNVCERENLVCSERTLKRKLPESR